MIFEFLVWLVFFYFGWVFGWVSVIQSNILQTRYFGWVMGGFLIKLFLWVGFGWVWLGLAGLCMGGLVF